MGLSRSTTRWIFVGAATLGLLLVAALLALPRLVDPERHREALRSRLERQLGREVTFGAMDVSVWPVLGLRLDDVTVGGLPSERVETPLALERLRVGARLGPLLRGRLDITSLTVERPTLTLFRATDGRWEPALPATDEEETRDEESPLVIERMRIVDGTVAVRTDDGEVRLTGVTLGVDGRGRGESLDYTFSATAGGSTTVRTEGSMRTSDADVSGNLRLDRVSPTTLRAWLAVLAPEATLPPDLLGDRAFDARTTYGYAAGPPARLAISDAVVTGLDVRLSRSPDGGWNADALLGGPDATGDDAPGTDLDWTDLTLEDAAVRVESFELSALRLSVRPREGSLEIDLDSGVGTDRGRLALRGTVGPPGDATPVDLGLSLASVSPAALGSLVAFPDGLDLSAATVTGDLRIVGAVAHTLEVAGTLSVTDAAVESRSPQGAVRRVALSPRFAGDLRLSDRGRRIEATPLRVELPGGGAGRALELVGTIDATAEPARIDVRLRPTRIPADDLAALAALLAPDAPLTFASPDPVELELRARGPLGGERLPELTGTATLSGFTFHVVGMAQPMRDVAARVTLAPERIELDGLSGKIGASELATGRVVVHGLDAPRLEIDLGVRNADFWELFSFVEASEETDAGGDRADIVVQGGLTIERGTLQTLAFERLATRMDVRDGVVTLSPLSMGLYGGKFDGRLVQDLGTGVLTLAGRAEGVDADAFLGPNLALGGVISGTATADLDVRVRTAESADLVAAIEGGGPLQVRDGRLAKLEVLRSLSRPAGIFGERSLQRLTRELGTAGTAFRSVSTRLVFDRGTITFEDVVLETSELTLVGRATLASTGGELGGRFAVAFSPELSATMREERSRAAELFWDPATRRVQFGFTVAGPVSAPVVKVDWDAALRGAAERKLADRLRDRLGLRPSGPAPATPPVETPIVGDVPAPPPSSGEEPGPSSELPAVEITRTRWTGPVLLRDLVVEGTVRGVGVERVTVAVVDARGAALKTIERPVEVDPASGQAVPFRVEIEGKDVVRARFPVRVTVTAVDREGRSRSVSRDVERF